MCLTRIFWTCDLPGFGDFGWNDDVLKYWCGLTHVYDIWYMTMIYVQYVVN